AGGAAAGRGGGGAGPLYVAPRDRRAAPTGAPGGAEILGGGGADAARPAAVRGRRRERTRGSPPRRGPRGGPAVARGTRRGAPSGRNTHLSCSDRRHARPGAQRIGQLPHALQSVQTLHAQGPRIRRAALTEDGRREADELVADRLARVGPVE